jgi:hypothetical protein
MMRLVYFCEKRVLSLLDENNTTTCDKDKFQKGIIEFTELWLVLIQNIQLRKYLITYLFLLFFFYFS